MQLVYPESLVVVVVVAASGFYPCVIVPLVAFARLPRLPR